MKHTKMTAFGILCLFATLLAGCGGSGGSSNPDLFSVGGTVSGLTGTLLLQNNTSDTLTLSADGAYTFAVPLPTGTAYQVVVAGFPQNQDCSVSNASGTIALANVGNIDVVCQPLDPIGLASLDDLGTQGDGSSDLPVLSTTGRFVAFESAATNLVSGDSNLVRDIFLYDRQAASSERVSVATGGGQASLASLTPAMSRDGRFVAFASNAPELVGTDTNLVTDIFLRDRQTGTTERVSLSSAGLEANEASSLPALSDDGRFVAFASLATNLVSGDTNVASDIFVRDRQTGSTERVSLPSAQVGGDQGSFAPRLSSDGRFVAFESTATTLVADDLNVVSDVFVRDRQTGTTELISRSSAGVQANFASRAAAITPDGRYVVFVSAASNLAPEDSDVLNDIYRHDRQTGATILVSLSSTGVKGNGASDFPAISADGRFVAFESTANNLVSGDSNGVSDIFVRDILAGTTVRRSVSATGAQAANGTSLNPALSADGNHLAFDSAATNLVAGDLNLARDVFVAPAK